MREKIIATLLTAIMALTSISPVLAAYDLGDYPTFLFKDHNLNAYVVAGADARPADVVGMTDLAVRLAGESYEEVSAEGIVTGAEEEDIPIGTAIAATGYLDTELDSDDIAGLQDTTVDFQDETYDVHDVIKLDTSSPTIATSGAADDDYGTDVVMETNRGVIGYYYIFDETINISKATNDEPLEIEFLGKTLKIIAVPSSTSFTVQVGDEETLNVGESVTFAGKTITLVNVGDGGTVIVDVNGVRGSIGQGTTKTVNGVKIKPTDYFYSDVKEERMATIVFGEETTKTYSDGDAYIGEDEDNPNWVWDLSDLTSSASGDTVAGGGPTIGVINYFIKDDPTDNPPKVGECYEFPEKFAKICIDALTVKATDYAKYTISYETGVDLSNAGHGGTSSDKVVQISSNVDESIILMNTSKKVKDMYIKAFDAGSSGKVGVFYKDPSDKKIYWDSDRSLDNGQTVAFAQVNYKDTKASDINLTIAANFTANNYATITFDDTITATNEDIAMVFYTDGTNWQSLGQTLNTEEASEVTLGGTNVGTKNEDHRTKYGMILRNPETHGASDEVVIEVPGDQVKATVRVYGPSGAVTSGGDVIKKVVPITNAVARLDTEISLPVNKHLVLVGGPAINRLSAQVLDLTYPTYGSSGLLPFGQGEGYIKVFENKLESGYVAVLVAGWEAADTRNACSVLQQYGTFKNQLDGNVAVKVTSVTAAGITPAT